MVTVIKPGKIVLVRPDALDEDDILDFAAAIVEEQGWVKGQGGDATQGWSIHGAVGEAARRATDSSGKDSTSARPLRDKAAAKVLAIHGKGEVELNDSLDTPAEAVIRLRQAARGVVESGEAAS